MQIVCQKFWLVIITLIIVPLASCSKTIVSDVTRFHNLPAPAGETIEVVSINPKLQYSLEFGQYAELVGQHLGSVGYRPPQGSPSRLIARIGYGIQPANDVAEIGPRSSVGIGVGVGGGSHHSNLGVGLSYSGGNNDPRQEYVRMLSMEIIRRSDGSKLYEGQVTNRGREGLLLVMPHLVDALFQDFPGESGTSNKVRATP